MSVSLEIKRPDGDRIETMMPAGKSDAGPTLTSDRGALSEIPTDFAIAIRHEGFELSNDGLVTWTDYDTIHHPSRWPLSCKLFDTSVILFFEFFT